MPKYNVRLVAKAYQDMWVDAEDKYEARDRGEEALSLLLDDVKLPQDLEWEVVEAWDIEEHNG